MGLKNKLDWKKMIDIDNPKFPEITEKTRKLGCYGHGNARGAVNALKILKLEEQKLSFFRRAVNNVVNCWNSVNESYRFYCKNMDKIWKEY